MFHRCTTCTTERRRQLYIVQAGVLPVSMQGQHSSFRVGGKDRITDHALFCMQGLALPESIHYAVDGTICVYVCLCICPCVSVNISRT